MGARRARSPLFFFFFFFLKRSSGSIKNSTCFIQDSRFFYYWFLIHYIFLLHFRITIFGGLQIIRVFFCINLCVEQDNIRFTGNKLSRSGESQILPGHNFSWRWTKRKGHSTNVQCIITKRFNYNGRWNCA